MMTWKSAALRVLREANCPLHFTTITERILEKEYLKTEGVTPELTVHSILNSDVIKDAMKSPFKKFEEGVFGLNPKVNSVEYEEIGFSAKKKGH